MGYRYLLASLSATLVLAACSGEGGDGTSANTALEADFSGDITEGIAPFLVNFTDTSQGDAISAWTWQFGDGFDSQVQNPTHIYADAGTYTVSLEVSSSDATDQQVKVAYIVVEPSQDLTPTEEEITPHPTPEPPKADFSSEPQTGYAPLAVTFSDESDDGGSNIHTWLWEFGDDSTSAEQNPSHTYSSPGFYSVKLNVETEFGQDSKNEDAYIKVYQEPDAPLPEKGAIVINELLAHASNGEQWIELHNTTDENIDLSGWLLSDSLQTLAKYTFPANTIISPQGFLLLMESQTFANSESGDTPIPFQLSPFGGDLLLTSAQGGQPTGYLESKDYGASNIDISFGRYEKSTGTYNFIAQETPSPGTENGDPLVGPIVISEIYYNPVNGSDFEFVELHNISDENVDLGSGWIFSDGIDYTFNSGENLLPGEYLVLAKNPDTLQIVYGDLAQTTTVLGPYEGKLSNDGETLQIASPGPEDSEGKIHPVRVDRVNYDVEAPWPEDADGSGHALFRLDLNAYGNDVANWLAATASPGSESDSGIINDNDSIIITEIMYNPPSGEVAHEYIELLNNGTSEVDLVGWSFSSGINFSFPSTIVAPGQYVIVSANTQSFSAHYGAADDAILVGDYDSRLSDKGEKLTLSNHLGEQVDTLSYADDGPWAERHQGADDRGHTGWIWYAEHDGLGKSLERQSLVLPTHLAMNWRSSLREGGSPGLSNSIQSNNIAPLISEIKQLPLIPRSNETVNIQAMLTDESENGLLATLWYRMDGNLDFTSQEMSMVDGDTIGLYQGTIPAHGPGSIVEYYVQATDAGGLSRTWPSPSQPMNEQLTNHLYQVVDDLDLEIEQRPKGNAYCRITMTEAERAELEDIGNGVDEDETYIDEEYSDAKMNATYICLDENNVPEVRFLISVRNRGASSRSRPPNNYRLNFLHSERWKGITAYNINSKWPHSQILGSKLWQLAGLPASDANPLQLRINGENLALNDVNMHSAYAQIEALNSDFVGDNFPSADKDGNLYRGKGAADLTFLGEGSGYYIGRYVKQTNEDLADWSDVTYLTQVLSEAPDAGYIQSVEEVLVLEQWLRYFALDTLVNNVEGGLCTGKGDDYAMFAGIDDSRFSMIPHDLDSTFGNPQPYADFKITGYGEVAGLQRLFQHQEIMDRYYGHIMLLLDTVFTEEIVFSLMDEHLGSWVDEDEVASMKAHMLLRTSRVLQHMFWTHIVPFETQWLYDTNPETASTNWTTLAFDDSQWAGGAAPLGYGNNNEATLVDYGSDDQNKPITTYFRNSFEVDDPNVLEELQLYLFRDDGAIVYLNGEEVLRSNMPEGQVDNTTLASSATKSADELILYEASLDPSDLIAGTNILAVEVHLIGPASGDMKMDANLVAKPIGAEQYTPVQWSN